MKAIQLKLLVQLAATVISVVSAQSPLRAAANKDRKKKHQQRFLETSNGPERTIQELKDFQRNLQELPCNVPSLMMDRETIAATLTATFTFRVSQSNVQDANQILDNYIPMIEHDVQFMKVSQSVILYDLLSQQTIHMTNNLMLCTLLFHQLGLCILRVRESKWIRM